MWINAATSLPSCLSEPRIRPWKARHGRHHQYRGLFVRNRKQRLCLKQIDAILPILGTSSGSSLVFLFYATARDIIPINMEEQRPDQAPSHSEQPPLSPPSATPTWTSEDSDTVFLENPEQKTHISTPQATRPAPPNRQSTTGVKKCWICICESTEDDPSHPPRWRSPCTCNLTAHEDCLLDWVADLENPKNRKRDPPPNKILCPQCKSEIKIARPRNYVVDSVRGFDRVVGQAVLPGLGFSLVGTIWTGFCIHGMFATRVVFGANAAGEILEGAVKHGYGSVAAYGLVPLSLIFSRTQYADFVLPWGTLFLLSTQVRERFEIDMTIWPPLSSTVFACLPAIRMGYNFAYEKAFGEMNRRWIREVQPRQGEGEPNEADAANAAADAAMEGGGFVVELDINLGLNGGEDEGEADVPPLGAQANDNEDGNGNGNAPAAAAAGNQNGGVHQIFGPRGEDIVDGTSGLGQSVLGALAFPWVAAGMGGLLSFALPASWMTNANWMNGRPGLLRNRWGRTVIGGMAFVVLKDALMLYCRWRIAQGFRQRRIMDFDKVKKIYKLNN